MGLLYYACYGSVINWNILVASQVQGALYAGSDMTWQDGMRRDGDGSTCDNVTSAPPPLLLLLLLPRRQFAMTAWRVADVSRPLPCTASHCCDGDAVLIVSLSLRVITADASVDWCPLWCGPLPLAGRITRSFAARLYSLKNGKSWVCQFVRRCQS